MTPELRLVALAMIVAAAVPTAIIIAFLVAGRREARRMIRQLEVVRQQSAEIHTMVNDQLTREKSERLVLLRAQLLLLGRAVGIEPTTSDRALIKTLELQAAKLEQEIAGRDAVADVLADERAEELTPNQGGTP